MHEKFLVARRSESKAELPKDRLVMKGIHEADLPACSEPQRVVEDTRSSPTKDVLRSSKLPLRPSLLHIVLLCFLGSSQAKGRG